MRTYPISIFLIFAFPSWSQTVDFSKVSKKAGPAIYIVGTENQEHGTAFVISKKHRLLVTNAHVADLSMRDGIIAVQNKKSETARVKEVFYHPRITRQIGVSQVIEGIEDRIGKVFVSSPDIAILQLEGKEELEAELELAPFQEILEVDQGLAVGMIGFWGKLTEGVPDGEARVLSNLFQGYVSRVTDFFNLPSESDSGGQRVQHSMGINDTRGLSGAPIMNIAGQVVAVNNATRPFSNTTSPLAQPDTVLFGVRADCIWETIAANGLDELVPLPIAKEKLNLATHSERTKEQEEFVAAYNKLVFTYAFGDEKQSDENFSEFVTKYPEVPRGHLFAAEAALLRASQALYWGIISSDEKQKQEAKSSELSWLEKSKKHFREYEKLWGESQEISFSLLGIEMRLKAANGGITEPDRKKFRESLRDILLRVPHRGLERLSRAAALESFLVEDPKSRAGVWERIAQKGEHLDAYLYQAESISSLDREKSVRLARQWHDFAHIEREIERSLRALVLDHPPTEAIIAIYRGIRELDPQDIRPNSQVHRHLMLLALAMGDWKRAGKHALKTVELNKKVLPPDYQTQMEAYYVDLVWHLLNDFNDYHARSKMAFNSRASFQEESVKEGLSSSLENKEVFSIPMYCSSEKDKFKRQEYYAFVFAREKGYGLAVSRDSKVPEEGRVLPATEFTPHPENALVAKGDTIRLRATFNWDTRSPGWALFFKEGDSEFYCISQ